MKTGYNRYKWRGRFVLLGILILGLVTLIVMLLWNWLMPVIFSLSPINYWQALGLLVLSKILFSGFGRKGRPMHGHTPWRNRFMEKWHACQQEKDHEQEIKPEA